MVREAAAGPKEEEQGPVEGLPERLDVCLRCPPIQEGEGCGMTCMSLDGQGQLMVTGCRDGRNIVWDLETRGVRVVLEDSRWLGGCPVESVLLSRDGCFVMSCHSVDQDPHVVDGDARSGGKKVLVLWSLGRSSEATVVATHEIAMTGAVSMCMAGVSSPFSESRQDETVLMMVLMTCGGVPMWLRVCGTSGSTEDALTNLNMCATYPVVVGVGSIDRDVSNMTYHMESFPLTYDQGIPGAVVKDAEEEEKKMMNTSATSYSGGTTVTNALDDDGDDEQSSKRKQGPCVGSRVQVYWDGDGEWFSGTVRSQDLRTMFIVYDDGDEEWVPIHGDVPWKLVDDDGNTKKAIKNKNAVVSAKEDDVKRHMNVLVAYCAKTDVIALCDKDGKRLTLHSSCDFSVVHDLELEHVEPSRMTFSQDGTMLAVTYASGFIELVQILESEMKVIKRLDFLEYSTSGRRKKRQHAWVCSAFSPGGTYIFCSMTTDQSSNNHCILTWNHEQNVVKNLLQGQGAKVLAMECHPVPTPMQILALSDDGCVYIWSSIMYQNWSTFQPEFETLERNREYVEVETEFDLPATQDSSLAIAEGIPRVLHDEDIHDEEEIRID